MELSSEFLSAFDLFSQSLKREDTKKSYLSEVQQLVRFCKKDFFLITPTEGNAYLVHLYEQCRKGELKESTAVRKYRTLLSLYGFCEEHPEVCPSHEIVVPFTNVPFSLVPKPVSTNGILSNHELDVLIGYAKTNDTMLLLAILFSFKLFLKTEEFLSLKFSDISYNKDYQAVLQIEEGEGRRRFVSIPRDVYEIFCDYRTVRDDVNPFVFSKPGKNKPYTKRTLLLRIEKACVQSELSSITFNELRNTGAYYAKQGGATEVQILKSLGLKSNRHAWRYDFPTIEDSASDFIHIYVKK